MRYKTFFVGLFLLSLCPSFAIADGKFAPYEAMNRLYENEHGQNCPAQGVCAFGRTYGVYFDSPQIALIRIDGVWFEVDQNRNRVNGDDQPGLNGFYIDQKNGKLIFHNLGLLDKPTLQFELGSAGTPITKKELDEGIFYRELKWTPTIQVNMSEEVLGQINHACGEMSDGSLAIITQGEDLVKKLDIRLKGKKRVVVESPDTRYLKGHLASHAEKSKYCSYGEN